MTSRRALTEDGVEALTQEDHEQRLKYLDYVYNSDIKKIDKFIKEFGKTMDYFLVRS